MSKKATLKLMHFSVAIFVLLHFGLVFSQILPTENAYKLLNTKYSTLIVETVYPYKSESYVTKSFVIPINKTSYKQSTPEDVLSAMIASIKAKDWECNSSLWTPESIKDMIAKDKVANKKKEDWLRDWDKEINRNFIFLTKIQYGKYVLIEYEAQESNAKSIYRDTIAFEKINDKWYLTQKLAADPILMHWNNPKGRIQIAPDKLFDK